MLLRILCLAAFCATFTGCFRRKAPPAGSAATTPAPSQAPSLVIHGTVEVVGDFKKGKDLSGIARIGTDHGLVVSDELRVAQKVRFSQTPLGWKIQTGALVPLLDDSNDTEADLEGVAANPQAHCYYAVGSHGVAKKSGEFESDRCHVFRIPADPATGEASSTGVTRVSLLPWLEKQATLAPYLKKSLQQRGFNIEGVAYSEGKLFFGVRGPNIDGKTYVIETAAEALFAGGEIQAVLHEIPLNVEDHGLGIRELVPVAKGFLFLLGNAGSESEDGGASLDFIPDRQAEIAFWDGKNSLKKIGALPGKEKAEGMLVLSETAAQATILILFDGVSQGGPIVCDISLP